MILIMLPIALAQPVLRQSSWSVEGRQHTRRRMPAHLCFPAESRRRGFEFEAPAADDEQ
jgi:hypothetical protein